MKTDEESKRFKELLDDQYEWPSPYTFKFIVPKVSEEQAESVFSSGELAKRVSKSGKYVSITSKMNVNSSEEVLSIYEKARDIPGIVSL